MFPSAPQSTDSNIRYAAYATRIRTALLSAQRYVAYTSDIGESFRPIVHPNLVRAAYGISWAYLLGDVTHEGYKAYCHNQTTLHPELPREASHEHYNDAKSELKLVVDDVGGSLERGKVIPLDDYRTVMAQRALFQGIASMVGLPMANLSDLLVPNPSTSCLVPQGIAILTCAQGLPAFTIHSIVRYSSKALKDVKNRRIRAYGPIGLGLAAVPALPYLFDKPVEEAVEWVFYHGFKVFGGQSAVGNTPSHGREKALGKPHDGP
jgi:fission process protein 1